MERENYIKMAETEDTHFWYVVRREIIGDVLDKYVSDKKHCKILDIGAGTGGNVNFLKTMFPEIKGAEMDEEAREVAKEKYGLEFEECCLPNNCGFSDEKFDVVMLLDVLEHIEDDRKALSRIYSKLKDNGLLVLTVPACPFLWSDHDVKAHHFRRYDKRKLQDVLHSAGYSIRYISYFNSLLFPLVTAIRFIKQRFNLKNEIDETKVPNFAINTLLKTIFGLEKLLLKKVKFSFGVSLVVVATRTSD